MTVNICGIPHKVIEAKDNYDSGHCGLITYGKCEIRIEPDMVEEAKKETICHEIIHGIFTHLGYMDYANNEQLVQALGNAVYQSFDIKEIDDDSK